MTNTFNVYVNLYGKRRNIYVKDLRVGFNKCRQTFHRSVTLNMNISVRSKTYFPCQVSRTVGGWGTYPSQILDISVTFYVTYVGSAIPIV